MRKILTLFERRLESGYDYRKETPEISFAKAKFRIGLSFKRRIQNTVVFPSIH